MTLFFVDITLFVTVTPFGNTQTEIHTYAYTYVHINASLFAATMTYCSLSSISSSWDPKLRFHVAILCLQPWNRLQIW